MCGARKLHTSLEETDALGPFQSGFRPGSGAKAALVAPTDDLLRAKSGRSGAQLTLCSLPRIMTSSWTGSWMGLPCCPVTWTEPKLQPCHLVPVDITCCSQFLSCPARSSHFHNPRPLHFFCSISHKGSCFQTIVPLLCLIAKPPLPQGRTFCKPKC